MGKVIGIDLGTTNSCVALIEGGQPEVIANVEGSRTTPSVVGFTNSGEKLIGQLAKRQAVTNPKQTIFAVKRLIGRRWDTKEIQEFLGIAPYEIEAAENGDAWVAAAGRHYSPQEISAIILEKMKDTAREFLGEPIEDAVITVPAYFDDAQRQATKDAGRIAGLNVLRIINEPTAAALSYGLGKEGHQVVAVFDLGGGTFDISILEIGDGVFQVRSTHGDTALGGEDFDRRLVQFLIEHFKKETGIDLSQESLALQRLKEAAENAKHELSSVEATDINLPFISADDSGPKHLNIRLSREKLEALVEDLIERLVEPCEVALKDAGLSTREIDEVILVGGMTRMPRIKAKVREIFGKEPNQGVNPDEVVAIGAAIQGGVIHGEVEEVLLLDVTPLSLGVETQGNVMTKIIEKNTTIPTCRSEILSTTEDNQSFVSVHVLQGEREMASDNKTLGRFELVGIPPAPRGVPQIEISFDIDVDGVVHVSAKDLGTGKEQAIEVSASGGLTEEEVTQLVRDAEKNAASDQQRRALATLRNKAEGLIYSSKRTMAECQELDKGVKDEVSNAIIRLEKILEKEDAADLSEAVDELSALSYKVAEAMYSKFE